MSTSYKSLFWSISLLLALSLSISASPGNLDPTFGSGGIAITTSSASLSLYYAWGLAIQTDGKIVVVGEGVTGIFDGNNWWDFAVVRYNPDGSLDSSFGGTGIVITQVSTESSVASSVAIQADSKIVVGGGRHVVRYNPNGSLDTSFNGTGKVNIPGVAVWSVAIQADGKIIAAGSSHDGSVSAFTVVRYNPDGSLDTSFNGTGKVVTPGGVANSVAVQADGKIVAAGTNGNGTNGAFTLVRYHADGTPDTSFNGTGKAITPVGNSSSGASDLAIQTDGKIVAAGYSLAAPNDLRTGSFALVRYNPDGSLDTSFGGTGEIIIPDGDLDFAYSVAIQPNGKIVVAGSRTNIDPSDKSAVVRLNPNGSLDTSFNGTGKVTTAYGPAYDHVGSVAIQADGKIVVAGDTGPDEWKDFVVVRYQGDDATATPTPTAIPTPTPLPTPSPTLRGNGKIAFTSDRDGNREIYVMNVDGSNQVRLTNNSLIDDYPTWSPDGTKMAFVCQISASSFALCLMNADGTDKAEVTRITNFVGADPFQAWSMSWSPDGSEIAFQSNSSIYATNANGDIRRLLLVGSGWEPSWSRDGSKILFSSIRDHNFPTLYTVDSDGTNLQAFPGFDGNWELAPDWSPTGDKVLFVADYTETHPVSQILIQNADGTNRQSFDGLGDEAYRNRPRWSPDGSKIVFDKWELSSGDMEIYLKNIDGSGFAQLTNMSGWNFHPSWQPLAPAACPNPIDCADLFVRHHYLDFLNRDPDDAGRAFWSNEITSCGVDAQCIEVKRINVSAAFFLSIEFQQTGYLAYRAHKAAFGDLAGKPVPVTREEMLQDVQVIGSGVVVNTDGWEQKLEQNKQTYFAQLAASARFTTLYPQSLTPEQFVDALNANAVGALSQAERNALVADLSSGSKTRAQALRAVAEDADLLRAEFNRAFVLMQYFGYLRRNPDNQPDSDFAGFNFWLAKLEQFQGNYIQAEMVKAFISSTEYRLRFGPP